MDQARRNALLEEGRGLHRAGRYKDAARCYGAVLAADPQDAGALALSGILAAQTGALERGESLLRAAIEIRPGDAKALSNLGTVLLHAGRAEEALATFDAAIRCDGSDPEILFNAANAMVAAGRDGEATKLLETAHTMAPDDVRIQANLGNLYRQNGALEESRQVLALAAAALPDDAEIQHSLGLTLSLLREYDAALNCFRRAVTLDPGFTRAAVQLFHQGNFACDWSDRGKLTTSLCRLVEGRGAGLADVSPMVALHLPLAQEQLSNIAAARVQRLTRGMTPLRPSGTNSDDPARRLRVGYISADFGDHPVGYLTANLYAAHDRNAFEIFAYDLNPAGGGTEQGGIAARIRTGVDFWCDLSGKSDQAAAAKIAADDIDILVDLGGFTSQARPEILLRRPARLLAGWLGFCGSAGGMNDVLIADSCVAVRGGFAEPVANMPDSFMPITAVDPADGERGLRHAHNLPATGTVFSAFGSPAKIDPESFALWMRILGQVHGSVLWLRTYAEATTRNLRQAAAAANVDPDRLVFAGRTASMADHLARQHHADLFLDTLVYGAHTTAGDSLAAGVPVLTCAGPCMQNRVAASLNLAIGMPELVVGDIAAYEALAVALAADRGRLAELRDRLVRNIGAVADPSAFTRRLERTFRTVWQAACAGEMTQTIEVS